LPSADTDLTALEEKYHRDDFLLFSRAFPDRVPYLDAAIRKFATGENSRFSHQVTELVRSGKTPDFTSGAKIPWVQYEAGTDVSLATVLRPCDAHRVRKLMGFVGFDDNIDSVAQNKNLERVVARLLNCQIDELELFQDMALLKPPGGREKPWHQNKAYFDIALETLVVGCWIAVDKATCESGCMHMLRRGHFAGPRMHFPKRDYQICDDEVLSFQGKDSNNKSEDDVVALPLPAGGIVLFDGMIPHGTPTNTTSESRRALQFHWVKRGAAKVRPDEPGGRIQSFGGTKNGLSC